MIVEMKHLTLLCVAREGVKSRSPGEGEAA